MHVTRHRVVVQIAFDHTAQPSTDYRHRFMASSHQLFPNGCQRCTHPFLYRQSDDKETASRLTAAVREHQKVECFRLSCFTFPALLRRVSSKSDQSRLVRVKFQLEFGKAHSHCCEKTLRGSFILESHHTVIGIAYEDDITNSMSLTPRPKHCRRSSATCFRKPGDPIWPNWKPRSMHRSRSKRRKPSGHAPADNRYQSIWNRLISVTNRIRAPTGSASRV